MCTIWFGVLITLIIEIPNETFNANEPHLSPMRGYGMLCTSCLLYEIASITPAPERPSTTWVLKLEVSLPPHTHP